MIIDGDGHVYEPMSLWGEYVERPFRDRIVVARDEQGRARKLTVGDVTLFDAAGFEGGMGGLVNFGPGDVYNPGGLDRENVAHRTFEEAEPAGWDSSLRLAMHDREGIDAAVLFPTLSYHAAACTDHELGAAATRGANRWLADYCSAAPDELYGTAVLPTQEPELAAAELRRCVEQHGFVAGVIRPLPDIDGRLIGDPRNDVLWATAQELDVAIAVHNVTPNDRPQTAQVRARSFMYLHAITHPFEGMLAFGSLFEAGVFDRFPRLRVGFLESGSGWAPFWVERMHEHWEHLGWMMGDAMPRRGALEVFAEQCVVGTEGDDTLVGDTQRRFGDESVMWASDFPHYDTHSPFVTPMLERTDLSPTQLDGAMRRASLRFYQLDQDSIARSNRSRREGTRTWDVWTARSPSSRARDEERGRNTLDDS